MALKLSVLTAAKMADQAYKPRGGKIAGYRIIATHKGHATAYMLSGRILVIRGSDSAADYIRYNLRVLGLFRSRLTIKGKPGQAAQWHQGFLVHVAEIEAWLRSIKQHPKFIVGHSLGAASAQVLSHGWKVPAIGFAAPRVCRQRGIVGQSKRCLLINRTDDIVPQIPEGFQHIGKIYPINMGRVNGHKHKMRHYRSKLPSEIMAGRVPRQWP